MRGHGEAFLHWCRLTGGDTQQRLLRGGEAQAIYIHSMKPRKDYLGPKCFVCDSNRVDWKWVTSVECNLKRFWMRTPWKRRNRDRKWFGYICALPCRAGHLNSASAPNVSCHWRCEYDYTLILALAHRIERHELELGTDWQEELSNRTLFAGAVDLFVCNRAGPQGCVSSAKLKVIRIQDKKACRSRSSSLKRLMFFSDGGLKFWVQTNAGSFYLILYI